MCPDAHTDQALVAVYDFDNTSIEGSSPLRLVLHLTRRFRLKLLTSLKIGFWGLAYKMRLPQNESWVRSQVFKAFEGEPKDEVDQYLALFYDNHIEHRFRPAADASMRKHAEEGHAVLVVSASFEPIVLRAMERHPFDAQISTRMKVAPDGTYTRETEGLPVEGEEKRKLIQDWCDEHFGEGGWRIVAAYGDHHSDEPMLSLAENAYAVNPNSTLEKIAIERGWTILDWSIKSSAAQ